MRILGHRGAKGEAPENTIPGFVYAKGIPGLDAFEFDVHLSKDGELVVIHDATVDAAVLQGLEAIHASAVAWGDGAVAVVAPSGGGKSSIALQLALRGARFVTDDVLVIEPDDLDGCIAHPGPGTIGVRENEERVAGAESIAQVGRVLGRSDKAYVELPSVDGPRKLKALYFLRAGQKGERAAVGPLPRVDPLELLASTFVTSVRTQERMRTHLEVWARVAASVPCHTIVRTEGSSAAELARLIEEHALIRMAA